MNSEMVEDKPEPPKQKLLDDILKRFSESTVEMLEVIVHLFMRVQEIEKRLKAPLLN